MALIPKEYVAPKKEQRNVRLDPATMKTLERYCEFVESSPNYVVENLLRYTFRRDREFQAWLENQPATGSDDTTASRHS